MRRADGLVVVAGERFVRIRVVQCAAFSLQWVASTAARCNIDRGAAAAVLRKRTLRRNCEGLSWEA